MGDTAQRPGLANNFPPLTAAEAGRSWVLSGSPTSSLAVLNRCELVTRKGPFPTSTPFPPQPPILPRLCTKPGFQVAASQSAHDFRSLDCAPLTSVRVTI